MKFILSAGVVCLLGVMSLSGAPLDDEVKAFADAVKSSAAAKKDPQASASSMTARGRILTVETLKAVMQQDGREIDAEGIVSQLMSAHPSENVQQTGEALLQELEAQRKARADEFEEKAKAVLDKAQETITQAKKAADLDGLLEDLKSLTKQPRGIPSQTSTGKINATYEFVTQWQDYLAGMSSHNMEQAQSSLRTILNNHQIDAPTFFPRSVLLDRLVEASGGYPVPDAPIVPTDTDANMKAADAILAEIKTVKDIDPALDRVGKLVKSKTEDSSAWVQLVTLEKTRDDAVAGLPVTLNIKNALNGPYCTESISRVAAMELLAILPYYFGTDASNPPKENETVTTYLNRLSETADASGDLALLQRVVAAKVAFSNLDPNAPPHGTQRFLAGLTQDAGGQYALAVTSYQNALKDSDAYLPVKIVGQRLAAIKAAHPDEFEKGMTDFLTPPVARPLMPGMPGWTPPGFPNPAGAQGNPISVLPIPMTISLPARASAPQETEAATNAPPATQAPSTSTK